MKNNHRKTRKNAKRRKSFTLSRNKMQQLAIVLTLVVVKKAKGAINFPGKINGRYNRAVEIMAAVNDSTWVTIPSGDKTICNDSIDAYHTATPAGRGSAFSSMNNNLQDLILSKFQKAANADPEHAVEILTSGNFHVVIGEGRSQKGFRGQSGLEPGQVELFADQGPNGKNNCHDWMYSTDAGITFQHYQPSTGASKLLTDLPAGKYAWFKHELLINDHPQGQSQIIKIMVP